jgi:hypothetical protein
VIALTRNLHVFASRIATSFSAVHFSIWYIAQAWNVRALLCFLLRHYDFALSVSSESLFGDCMQVSKRQLLTSQGFSDVCSPQTARECPDNDGRVSISTGYRSQAHIRNKL